MNDEDLQKLWQSQAAPDPVRAMENLIATTREEHRVFRRTILFRDLREIGVGLVLLPIWIWMGLRAHADWTWYLMIPALLFVMGYFVVDRLRHRADAPQPSEPVAPSLAKALREVEHQIWLLRNILWWYLLPIGAALFANDLGDLVRGKCSVLGFVLGLLTNTGICWGVWWLNQYVVRRDLEPRRQQLQELLARICEEN
jgi:hypothetical protein